MVDPYRSAFRVSNWLIKTPRLSSFRKGLWTNRYERRFARLHRQSKQVCPVFLSDPFGLFVVTPRARPLADSEAAELNALQLLDLFILPDGFVSGEPSKSRVQVWRDRFVIPDCSHIDAESGPYAVGIGPRSGLGANLFASDASESSPFSPGLPSSA